MTPIAVGLATLAAIMAFSAAPVAASDASDGESPPSPSPTAEADDGEDIYKLAGQQEVDESDEAGDSDSTETTDAEPGASTLPPGHWEASTPCDALSNTGCRDFVGVTCPDGEQAVLWSYVRNSDGAIMLTTPGCPGDPPETEQAPPVDIPAEALKAFEKVELPASTITVQPPGGETLVNFKTILSTQAERHQVNVRLEKVNLNLVLEVWPSHFLWHHGDGTTQESTIAGLRWSEGADVDGEGFITHVYKQTLKAAQVSVDTTWSAQFKVAGEPDWRLVNGTVTKIGDPVPLTVREAKPELVTEPN